MSTEGYTSSQFIRDRQTQNIFTCTNIMNLLKPKDYHDHGRSCPEALLEIGLQVSFQIFDFLWVSFSRCRIKFMHTVGRLTVKSE